MKICKKCGALNSNNKWFCVDCGATLPKKLSATEEKQMHTEINDQIEEMYNQKDPYYINAFDKVTGVIAILGLIAIFAFIEFSAFTNREHSLEAAVYAIAFFAVAILDSFVPHLALVFERIRLGIRFDGTEHLSYRGTPSALGKRIANVILILLGLTLLVCNILIK